MSILIFYIYSFLSLQILYLIIRYDNTSRMFLNLNYQLVFSLTILFLLMLVDIIDFRGLLFLTVLLSLGFYIHKLKTTSIWWYRVILFIFLFVCIICSMHVVPGVNNPIVFKQLQLSDKSMAFDLYANVDKVFVGIALLYFLLRRKSTTAINYQYFWLIIPLSLSVILIAWAAGLDVDVKLTKISLFFFLINLFLSSITEEIFFRGIVQKNSVYLLTKYNLSPLIGIIIASIIFALAHYGGGSLLILLAFFAGLAYGWVYYKTESLLAAALTHTIVNTCHFVFFVYPMPINMAP